MKERLSLAFRRMLGEADMNPASVTRGCFDRRFWAWKNVDFPEATMQRNVLPVAWCLENLAEDKADGYKESLRDLIRAGFAFAIKIQHKNGSFDQAFPSEYSYGATAFILESLAEAYGLAEGYLPPELKSEILKSFEKAAGFLLRNHEAHGLITNHLAGAALALKRCASLLENGACERKSREILDGILNSQSPEGWFPEYEGADPGYQTLCLHYLAGLYKIAPNEKLRAALERALEFLSYFVHPDGTFGGTYGSRRTSVYYPGGIALLRGEFPLAGEISDFMEAAIEEGKTTTVTDVDIPNMAPLFSSWIALCENRGKEPPAVFGRLPFQWDSVSKDFPEAGLFARGTRAYYAVLGGSNGGVLKVFDKARAALVFDDAGYLGTTTDGGRVSTQKTGKGKAVATGTSIQIEARFHVLSAVTPSPGKYLALRLLNLSVCRSLTLGNLLKKILVKGLITRSAEAPLKLERAVAFGEKEITVEDRLVLRGLMRLKELSCGAAFNGIHMASAGYFQNDGQFETAPRRVDALELERRGETKMEFKIIC